MHTDLVPSPYSLQDVYMAHNYSYSKHCGQSLNMQRLSKSWYKYFVTIVVRKVSQSGCHGIPQAECQLALFDIYRALMAHATNLNPTRSASTSSYKQARDDIRVHWLDVEDG